MHIVRALVAAATIFSVGSVKAAEGQEVQKQNTPTISAGDAFYCAEVLTREAQARRENRNGEIEAFRLWGIRQLPARSSFEIAAAEHAAKQEVDHPLHQGAFEGSVKNCLLQAERVRAADPIYKQELRR